MAGKAVAAPQGGMGIPEIPAQDFSKFGPIEEKPLSEHQVAFRFDDEYWNDELRDYRFSLKSRCIEETAQ